MSTNIKKFVATLLLFIPVAIVVYVIMICLWGDFAPNLAIKNLKYNKTSSSLLYTRLEEAKTVKNVDVLVLGSSHAYRGFDPRIFKAAGLTMFNLGSSAQTPLQTKVLVDRYLDKLNPKTVIYEVYPKTFSLDGIESAINIIANDRNDFETFKMCLKMKHILPFNVFIYGFYRDILGRDKNFKDDKYKEDTYISGGFIEKRADAKHIYEKHERAKWELYDYQLESFESVLEELKKRNVKVYLVNAPITKDYYNSITNHKEFNDRMKKFGDYHDFNNKVELNDTIDFYDSGHLKQSGVNKFNAKLLSELFGK